MARNDRQRMKQGEQRDPGRDWQKDYAESDLKHVFSTAGVKSWNDAIKYLDRKGMNDNELTPGEVIHMKDDLQKAEKQHIRFTSDASQAYKALHRAR